MLKPLILFGLVRGVTAVFVVVASRVHRPRQSLLYAAALGAHPHQTLYSLKLDTSLFALLPVTCSPPGTLASRPKGNFARWRCEQFAAQCAAAHALAAGPVAATRVE